MIYCMKFMAEDHYRLETEKKLSQAQEKTSHAAEQLETCKKIARELEENLEIINRYYQKQTLYYEKKAYLNWLVAQNSEKQLNYLTMVNASERQKFTKMKLEFEMLEDSYAFDISHAAYAREPFPPGGPPLGNPSPERKALLTPLLLEGPLRPPPWLPQVGGKSSRSPENPLDHPITNGRVEPCCDSVRGSCRAPPETGSPSRPSQQDER
jgi:hypothetical protein